jgi:ribosomal-protein-alanine N-acetyltransferase
MTPTRMAALHAASFPRGWSVAEIEALLAKPTTLCTSTEHGFALLQSIPPEAEILTIVIDPARRGQGHGAALLGQALLAAEDNGAETVFLEVDARNAPALALYQRAGFRQTGLRRAYYAHADGTRSDALTMTRHMPAQSVGT